ncbi:MAG: 3'-5' exonuclease [Tannerellaceae bacterium]
MDGCKIETSITKEEVALLPVEEFRGRVIEIYTVRDAERAVLYLSQFKKLGFDTETKPSFTKGKSHKVALMQISTDEACFLFRLNRIGIPPVLLALLTNTNILKIGLSLKDDFGALRKRARFEPGGFVDLQNYVKEFGIQDASLQKIYALLFHKRISKGQRLTNWEAEILTEPQKRYASLDAWSCLKIYEKLQEKKEHDRLSSFK